MPRATLARDEPKPRHSDSRLVQQRLAVGSAEAANDRSRGLSCTTAYGGGFNRWMQHTRRH